MTGLIAALSAAWLAGLVWEGQQNRRARGRLDHVIHVNGTRGKSTVSRLIEAGLREGGIRVFCKTTGTDPMTIDVAGTQALLRRRGKANIKEQLKIMRLAAAQGAQVLVVECMAVQPELQHAAQHQILKADVGVITNVRRDHADVMGDTLADVCRALCNTVPRGGVLFTAEQELAGPIREAASRLDTEFYAVVPAGDEPDFDFEDNIALALAVCRHLGVDRETALAGMARYQPDPYALSVHRVGEGIFINGLSVNDVQSTCMVWQRERRRFGLEGGRLILLVNNRADRLTRARDMLEVCRRLAPGQVLLLGGSQDYMRRGLARVCPEAGVRGLRRAGELDFTRLERGDVIYAVGNIAGEGRAVMEKVRKEGTPYVQ